MVHSSRQRGSTSGRVVGSATLGTDGSIVITVPAWGVEYRGTVTIRRTGKQTQILVVQKGGPDDGRTWRLPCWSFYTD